MKELVEIVKSKFWDIPSLGEYPRPRKILVDMETVVIPV